MTDACQPGPSNANSEWLPERNQRCTCVRTGHAIYVGRFFVHLRRNLQELCWERFCWGFDRLVVSWGGAWNIDGSVGGSFATETHTLVCLSILATAVGAVSSTGGVGVVVGKGPDGISDKRGEGKA